MKTYPKHVDWGKVIATNEIMNGYGMPKYENKNLFKDDSWIDIIMDDVYDTFYIDEEEEEEAKVAKASEDMKLSIMKEKFLAMVESEKAKVKDYTKLVVTDDKGKGRLVKNNGKGKEAEHHHLKVNKDDKGKGKLIEDNKVNKDDKGKGKLIEDNGKGKVDDHDLDTFDLENIIKRLEKDFGRLLKANKAKESKKAKKAKATELAKQANKAMEAELKANEAKKAKKEKIKAKKAKEAMLAELKAKKAKNANEAMLEEVVQISSDEDDDEDPTAPTSTRSRAPTASTSTTSRAPTAFTSTTSRAPIASTSNAKATSTAPRGYKKIAMTGCVIALFAPNAHNAPPPSATRKRKST
nr:hypothetical protein [Tanacetum cinerariifolium]